MIVGIDLGTTHSLVARWYQSETQLAPNSLGEFLTPSVLAIGNEGQVLVGKSARERALTHPNFGRLNVQTQHGHCKRNSAWQ